MIRGIWIEGFGVIGCDPFWIGEMRMDTGPVVSLRSTTG
jgi:hypothetical protein